MNYNVKVFPLIDPKNLELVLNDWAVNHSGVRIEYITQSQVPFANGKVTICIWYTEG